MEKQLQMSGFSAALPFLLMTFLILPIWLAVLLPLTIVYHVLAMLVSNFVVSKKIAKVDTEEPLLGPSLTAKDSRELDLIIYGSSGYTGLMATKYLAKQYGSEIKWAIAGRNRTQLEKIKRDLGPRAKDLQIIVADCNDVQQLRTMVQKTKVVISTVGPFDMYGSLLVRMCAENGTHYCDITGEIDWVRKMIDKYDECAKRSGAVVVHLCGHDCVPWDLSAQALAAELRKNGDSMANLSFYDEVVGSASGGTIATIFHSLSNRVQYDASLGFDPLLKTDNGTRSSAKFLVANPKFLGYSREIGAWTGPFVMAVVNANCIKRSHAVQPYGTKVVYKEAQVYSNFFAGWVQVMGLIIFATILAFPPLKFLMFAVGLLPKPGQGPSEEELDKGFLKVTGIATGEKGTQVKSSFYFPTDPGYRDTARMLVEAGLTLALNKPLCQGGSKTPALAMGPALIDRLVTTGSAFNVQTTFRP